MTSAPVRDPLADHLITPQNAAFLLIDYQPAQLAAVRSMDHPLLLKNAVSTVRAIKAFGLPVVHSTVNVANGQGPTLPELDDLLHDDKPLDRTTVNSWEDTEFVQAVHATGRRKLIICALWTEICMAFTALDALREGYEVYPVVDAIGGTSPTAPVWTGSCRPAASRSAGSRSPASCSATGLARRRSRRSSRSCSPTASRRSERGSSPLATSYWFAAGGSRTNSPSGRYGELLSPDSGQARRQEPGGDRPRGAAARRRPVAPGDGNRALGGRVSSVDDYLSRG